MLVVGRDLNPITKGRVNEFAPGRDSAQLQMIYIHPSSLLGPKISQDCIHYLNLIAQGEHIQSKDYSAQKSKSIHVFHLHFVSDLHDTLCMFQCHAHQADSHTGEQRYTRLGGLPARHPSSAHQTNLLSLGKTTSRLILNLAFLSPHSRACPEYQLTIRLIRSPVSSPLQSAAVHPSQAPAMSQ